MEELYRAGEKEVGDSGFLPCRPMGSKRLAASMSAESRGQFQTRATSLEGWVG